MLETFTQLLQLLFLNFWILSFEYWLAALCNRIEEVFINPTLEENYMNKKKRQNKHNKNMYRLRKGKKTRCLDLNWQLDNFTSYVHKVDK